jgi:acetyltransferase
MSIRNLNSFFTPASIALIGASRDAQSVGAVVACNLLAGGFAGPVWFVNPKATEIQGRAVYSNIDALPGVPELAVIATPAAGVPALTAELGAKGTKAIVVLSAGFNETGTQGEALQTRMLEAARPYTLRVVGPNCLGVLAPCSGVNASFAHLMPKAGHTAFFTQSGAMLTAVVDWAAARNIGFSQLVSLGGMADVDFGDLLDAAAADPNTHAVLLYVESITHARKFMSAARRCARLKPVVVVKSGRHDESAKAARSHTGALAGSDKVYDAAFRRAGLLRVATIEDLFDTLETVSHGVRLVGDRFAILTNGGGAGVLATDHLIEQGGRLASLAPETLSRLNACLPPTWSGGNPIDIIGDAGAERYRESLEAVLGDPGVDAVIVINCPVAVASSAKAAEAVISVLRASAANSPSKPVLASWLGESAVAGARARFDEAGIPHYPTPEKAVTAALRLVGLSRAQELLMETPALSSLVAPDRNAARASVERALADGRPWLTAMEAHEVLAAYGIPSIRPRFASTPDEAGQVAIETGFPVALKILSRDIVHKSDVGGVALNLADAPAVARAARAMAADIAKLRPDARLEGFVVQPIVTRPGAHELIVGLSEDRLFGPVILFGQGGTAVEVVADQAVALPPLNAPLARDLIARTRIARLLAGYRDRRPADVGAVVTTLLALQNIAIDLPEIKELDINPLWADDRGVMALDARIRIDAAQSVGTARFAIKPYPAELERTIKDRAGTAFALRPIRPEDAESLQAMIAACDIEDIRMRFFSSLRTLPDMLAKRLTQIDYDREMAFVVVQASGAFAGVARLAFDPDHERAEYAVLVRTDLKGSGLGYNMMQELIAYARSAKAKQIFGDVLAENKRMLDMCAELGFRRQRSAGGPGIVQVELNL